MIFGIGTDITSIERFEKIFSKFGEQFLLKCYHPLEVAEFEKRLMPPAYLAKRFSAKEAFSKALGTGIRDEIRLKNIAILNSTNGAPYVELFGETKTFFNSWKSTTKSIHISISDTKDLVQTFVIIEGIPENI